MTSHTNVIVEKEGKWYVNLSFKNKLRRFSVMHTPKEDEELCEKTMVEETRITDDRKYQIDASIVNIMKKNKKLNHKELVNRVLEKIKFPINVPEIKVRIENLIEKEFIKRNPKNAQEYEYI